MTKRLRVTMSRTMWVDVDDETADYLTGKDMDLTDLSERVTQWERAAQHDPSHYDHDLEVDVEDDGPTGWWTPKPVSDDDPPRYLWSARHFLNRARYELACGRYREGHCPDLDRVNGALARHEDELRLMALSIDRPDLPEVKAWVADKAAAAPISEGDKP